MPGQWVRRILIASASVLLFVSAAGAAEPLRYELRFEKPNTHLMDITIRASGLSGPTAEFAMADWAPGAYFVENYAARVQGFSAAGPDDQPLAWRKADSQTWRIELGRATSATVHYQLYANTLQNNEAQYNERHVFIGGPAVWMYMVGAKERPIELHIAVPGNWKVATGMSRAGQSTFAAANYDWFADSPIEISDFAEKDFQVAGTTYHVVVHDVMGHRDFTKFTGDTQMFVEAIVPIFAPVTGTPQPAPFADYWFIFHIWPKAGGGLEHLNSTQTNYSQDWDVTGPAPDFGTVYERKLYVASHEFFHAWNVKRLRPKPLGPFDYSQMVHTPSLWISEGLTSYYAALALVHAGLITPEQYLQNISRQITKFEREPGRKERSIEDTSWDTWFRDPKTFFNLDNTWYSYYDGGQVVGHLLDFAIREQTNNQKSLDDWMRLLYQRNALPKPGFEPDDAIRAASEIAGTDMSDFFHRYISGKEPLPYEKCFAYAGIDVLKAYDPNTAWLGVATERNEDGRARIKNVIPGSPAEVAGLDRDDVILSLDSKAVDQEGFERAIAERRPGNPVQIALLRLGELKEISVALGAIPYPTYVLQPVEHPTELQQKIFRSWLGLK